MNQTSNRSRLVKYSDSGVNLAEIERSHKIIKDIANSTVKFKGKGIGSIIRGVGHYASFIEIGGGRAMAIHTDGVGTKVLIAQMMNQFDTVGIDCVAMCVNDLICVGAKPIAILDYLVLKKADRKLVREIMKGLHKGAEESGVAIVGGETAIHVDTIQGIGEMVFDLSATAVGIVEKKKILTGSNLKPRQTIIGIESSGIHSNGLTLARKILLSKFDLDESPSPLRTTIGKELLKPTRIYVDPVLNLLEKDLEISGLAHITGGSFTKLHRIGEEASLGFEIDDLPKPPAIFQIIQKEGRISDKEMLKTFNMGIGFCVCCPENRSKEILKILQGLGFESRIIGNVVSKRGVFFGSKKLS